MERFSGRVKECSSFGYCLFGLFLIIVIVMCIVMVTRSNESYTIQKKVD